MASKRNFWLGMMVGAAAGAATALLYAPKRGEELRHDISEKASDAGRKAGQAWGSVKESTSKVASRSREMIDSGRSRVAEAMRAGHKAAEEKRKELKAEMEESERKAEMKS